MGRASWCWIPAPESLTRVAPGMPLDARILLNDMMYPTYPSQRTHAVSEGRECAFCAPDGPPCRGRQGAGYLTGLIRALDEV